jgi:hypothetical protein
MALGHSRATNTNIDRVFRLNNGVACEAVMFALGVGVLRRTHDVLLLGLSRGGDARRGCQRVHPSKGSGPIIAGNQSANELLSSWEKFERRSVDSHPGILTTKKN